MTNLITLTAKAGNEGGNFLSVLSCNLTSYYISFQPLTSSVSGPQYCRAYAIVRERDGGHSQTLCGGEQRFRNILVSKSHILEIRVIQSQHSANNFVLQYQGIPLAMLCRTRLQTMVNSAIPCVLSICFDDTLSEQMAHSAVDLHLKRQHTLNVKSQYLLFGCGSSIGLYICGTKVTPESAAEHTRIKFSRYVYSPLSQLLLRVHDMWEICFMYQSLVIPCIRGIVAIAFNFPVM